MLSVTTGPQRELEGSRSLVMKDPHSAREAEPSVYMAISEVKGV